jgi:hypothetical protein
LPSGCILGREADDLLVWPRQGIVEPSGLAELLVFGVGDQHRGGDAVDDVVGRKARTAWMVSNIDSVR